jgi:hypothetical protein
MSVLNVFMRSLTEALGRLILEVYLKLVCEVPYRSLSARSHIHPQPCSLINSTWPAPGLANVIVVAMRDDIALCS